MEIVKVGINELISPEYNPRQITDEEMEKLKNSINEFGYVAPIIVNKHNNHIVGGNQRYEALKSLGYTDVDVIFVDEPDIQREKALNIALNKISGDWDTVKLKEILINLNENDFDLSLTGFEKIELTDLNIELDNHKEDKTEITEDDYEPEDDIEVTVKKGDIYSLGNHRLMCGDSGDRKNIDMLIDKDKIDLILTDPPYGINIVNTNGKIGGKPITIKAPLESVHQSVSKEREQLMGTVGGPGIVQAKRYKPILNDDKPYDPTILLELNVNSIIWGANNFASKLPDSPKWLVWYKKPMDKANNNFSDVELAWTNIKGKMCKMYHYVWSGMLREGNRKMELNERVHPTQKPVGLLINILNDYTDVNMNILDLYGGSGSTLIACEETNRNCYMMELLPYYCQIIINRWEEFTGKKAVKIN